MAGFLRKIVDWGRGPFVDAFWPRLQGPLPSVPQPRDYLSLYSDFPTEVLEGKLQLLYGTARESVRTIDSRLSGLMIFSSGLSAISIASLLAAVNLNPTTLPEGFFSIVLTLLVLYVLVQSCRCLLCAVAGLRTSFF